MNSITIPAEHLNQYNEQRAQLRVLIPKMTDEEFASTVILGGLIQNLAAIGVVQAWRCGQAAHINDPLSRKDNDMNTAVAEVQSPAAVSTASPRVGEPWPEKGGIYAGIMRGYGIPDYYLIVPKNPLAGRKFTWGPVGDASAAADECDGLKNTAGLADVGLEFPAIQSVGCLEIGGHTGIYLPSKREARLLAANVPELLPDGWMWTSTQYDEDTAWCQNPGGGQGWYGKDDKLAVLPVRRELIIQ